MDDLKTKQRARNPIFSIKNGPLIFTKSYHTKRKDNNRLKKTLR